MVIVRQRMAEALLQMFDLEMLATAIASCLNKLEDLADLKRIYEYDNTQHQVISFLRSYLPSPLPHLLHPLPIFLKLPLQLIFPFLALFS